VLAQALPFSKVAHRVLTLDAQPASASIASILVLVTGQLLVDDGQNVLQYSQMFHVGPTSSRPASLTVCYPRFLRC
jgi:hypothetical protein